jgi:hypothetical protein
MVRFTVVTDMMVMMATGDTPHGILSDLSGPFMVEFDHINVQEDEIERRAAEVLAAVWQSDEVKPSPSIQMAIDKLPAWEKISHTESPNRLQVLPGQVTSGARLVNGRVREIIVLTLNPELGKDEAFLMPALLRHADMAASAGNAVRCLIFFTGPDELDKTNLWRCPTCQDFVCM